MPRLIDTVRDEWWDIVYDRMEKAEAACNGFLFRKDRRHELDGLATTPMHGMFLWWNAETAYYFASEELRRWWDDNPRTTFAEYAVQRGCGGRSLYKQAQAAVLARSSAALNAGKRR